MRGTVQFYHDRKGYGFIEPEDGGEDVFFHITDAEVEGVEEGTELEFEVTEGAKGPRAVDIQVVE